MVDGGNAHFTDTRRREAALRERGLHFVGTGVSGGEEGALNGPSIMPGGIRGVVRRRSARSSSRSRRTSTAPRAAPTSAPTAPATSSRWSTTASSTPTCSSSPRRTTCSAAALGMSPAEIAEVFRELERGRPRVVPDRDHRRGARATSTPRTGEPFVDVVLDQAEQKGTGRWTVQTALDLGIPVTGIAEAVFARSLSGHAEQREAARGVLPGPDAELADVDDRDAFIEDVRRALYASKVVAYAQGFDMIRAGARRVRLGHRPRRDGHDLARRLHHPGPVPGPDPGGVRRRRRTCRRCSSTPYFADAVGDGQESWRRVVGGAARAGVPVPGFACRAGLLRRAARASGCRPR